MSVVLENAKSIAVKAFHGLMTAAEETKLPSGYSPDLLNIWTDESPGSVHTGKGMTLVGAAPTSNPITFLYNFRKDDGSQLVMVSDNSKVWYTRDFSTYTELISSLNPSFQPRAATVRGKLWITNGSDAVRVWDGITLTVLDGTGGTPNVPRGKLIIYYHERVFLGNTAGNRAAAYFSALTDTAGAEIAPDNAAAWPAINEIKVNEGDGEALTGFKIYGGKLHMTKPSSAPIWRLEGQDEFSYFPIRTNATVGPRSQESIVELDGLLQYVGLHGSYEFDGSNSERTSDPLNAQVGTAAFSVADIQQSELNNKFWIQSTSAEFALGTHTPNIATDSGGVQLKAADEDHDDFKVSAGAIHVNVDVDAVPGVVQLGSALPGVQTSNIALGKTVTEAPNTTHYYLHSPSWLTDGNLTNRVDFLFQTASTGNMEVFVQLGAFYRFGRVKLYDLDCTTSGGGSVTVEVYGWTGSAWVLLGSQLLLSGTHPTFTFDHADPPVMVSELKITGIGTSQRQNFDLSEVEFYPLGYLPSGKFTSRPFDYTVTPQALGNFSADTALNGGTATYFTQSSNDNITWDAEVACTNGGPIGSTPRRYLRWGANLTSPGLTTPQITKVYLPGVYDSIVNQVLDTILTWKSLESTYRTNGGTVNFYYRTASTLGGITAATWFPIASGSDIIAPPTNVFVQFKLELSSGDATREPFVDDVTINWVAGIAGAVQSTQLIHGIAWDGRYWWTGAEAGEAGNNVIVIRGRRGFESPWHLKRGWNILSFLIFNDSLYGGSSLDGKIYRLDYGYSLGGAAMDSYFQTGDLVGDTTEYQNQLFQLDVDHELMGPSATYSLSVGVSTDRGLTWVERTLPLLGTGRMKSAINIMRRGRHFRVRVRTNGIDQPWLLHGLELFYRPTLLR